MSFHRPLENSSVRTIYCNMEKSSGNCGISQHKVVLISGAHLAGGGGGVVARLQPSPQIEIKNNVEFLDMMMSNILHDLPFH